MGRHLEGLPEEGGPEQGVNSGVKRLGLIVHHTDAKREWAYDRDSSSGRLDRGLDSATANGWLLIDMASEWKLIFVAD